MSEPVPQHGDPTAVILARMEVKLDNALTEQSRHASTLDRHDATLNDHGNRLTAAETVLANLPSKIPSSATVWSALGVAVMALGVLVTFLAVTHGAG